MTGLLPEGRNDSLAGADIDIELDAVPTDDIVSGSPTQGIAELGTIGDCEVGIWELRDGVVTDTEVDEFFVVLSGSATVEFLDEDRSVEVRAGDVMRLVAGSRTRWTVTEHIRKVYISG